jgi:hypothetical protein
VNTAHQDNTPKLLGDIRHQDGAERFQSRGFAAGANGLRITECVGGKVNITWYADGAR